mgnify:FL=1
MPEKIRFFRNGVRFRLTESGLLKKWLEKVAHKEGGRLEGLNYIFCTDTFLLEMNRTHLGHDYFTDIITFDLSVDSGLITGDIYISVDRVRENATEFKEPFSRELQRVMVHGLLHLLGYKDKTKAEKEAMRRKEEACLSLLKK